MTVKYATSGGTRDKRKSIWFWSGNDYPIYDPKVVSKSVSPHIGYYEDLPVQDMMSPFSVMLLTILVFPWLLL